VSCHAASVLADSVFDSKGVGHDVIPAIGDSRALGGAVAASLDPFTASIISPCAAARSQALTISGGAAWTNTTSHNLGQRKEAASTGYPSLALTVPLKRVSILTGVFLEKTGKIRYRETATYPAGGAEGDITYDVHYKRESSIYSVPVFLSAALTKRLVASAGILASFCDMREDMALDFLASQYTDTEDVLDSYAVGESFAAAAVLDLDRLRIGGLVRTAPRLKGHLDRSNRPLGIWSSEDVTISSHEAFSIGLWAEPVRALSVEIDYDRNPWSRLELTSPGRADVPLSNQLVERWAVGVQYHSDYLWRASKYPLNLGYYRQPLDWRSTAADPTGTGRITEDVVSIGTSIPIGVERGSLGLAFEIGTRKAADTGNLKETTYTLSVSVAAAEAWRREIKR
jgi:hypothetical protein